MGLTQQDGSFNKHELQPSAIECYNRKLMQMRADLMKKVIRGRERLERVRRRRGAKVYVMECKHRSLLNGEKKGLCTTHR